MYKLKKKQTKNRINKQTETINKQNEQKNKFDFIWDLIEIILKPISLII